MFLLWCHILRPENLDSLSHRLFYFVDLRAFLFVLNAPTTLKNSPLLRGRLVEVATVEVATGVKVSSATRAEEEVAGNEVPQLLDVVLPKPKKSNPLEAVVDNGPEARHRHPNLVKVKVKVKVGAVVVVAETKVHHSLMAPWRHLKCRKMVGDRKRVHPSSMLQKNRLREF
jgi:hypothetical protein